MRKFDWTVWHGTRPVRRGLEACLDRAETSARGDILGALLDIAVWERVVGGENRETRA
jgi:hypothetical protein